MRIHFLYVHASGCMVVYKPHQIEGCEWVTMVPLEVFVGYYGVVETRMY